MFDVYQLGVWPAEPKFLYSELQMIETIDGNRTLLASAQMNKKERDYFANMARVPYMEVTGG